MGIDRAWADDQLLGDLSIAQPLRNQAQYLHFTFCQSMWIGWRASPVRVRRGLRTSVVGEHWLSLCCDGLLRRHRPPLGPGLGKGALPELDTDGAHHTLIVSMLAKRGKEGEEINYPQNEPPTAE